MSAATSPIPEIGSRSRLGLTQELILACLLLAEIVVFSVIGTNFATGKNAFEVVRLCAEIGLLALALTPVIVAGGIDLSVGSLMGLSAMVLGIMWKEWHLPIAIAALGTVAVGACAGSLNALLIGGLRLPPLIVTLGTFSLFRGLAEGLAEGMGSFTGFSEHFLFLGQGYLPGGIPTQLPILVIAAVGFWLMLHRTTMGRALYAIGLAPEGARHAGIPVERRIALIYVISGTTASLAAIIYMAHYGQAKADAGTGYELMAITAVVLGGTSIFGGRGTIHGTVLGLFAIAVLKNGVRLAALPSELVDILTGTVLLATIAVERLSASTAVIHHGEFEVKNSQVAVLGAFILLGAFVVAGSNWLLVRTIQEGRQSGGTLANPAAEPKRAGGPDAKRITVGMLVKDKGNPYFIACLKGAQAAAKELNIDLDWDGPTKLAPTEQNEIVEAWITRGIDVIAVSVENPGGISSVLRKARNKGIKVVTWDSDAEEDARDFFVNQATPQGIGQTLTDQAARILGGKGEFAIIKASLTAANMIAWEEQIKLRLKEKYPDLKLVDVRPCDDDQGKAFQQAKTILNAYPDVKLVMAICSPAVPGAAEAVKQSGRKDVKVIGLGLPNENRLFIKEGVTDCIVLWKTEDLGYLTVYTAAALKTDTLRPGNTSIRAGRLGNISIRGDNILLGTPFVFNKQNIDQFDF